MDQKATLTLDLKFHFFRVRKNSIGNKLHQIRWKKTSNLFSLQHSITINKSSRSIIKLKNKTNVHPLIAIRVTTSALPYICITPIFLGIVHMDQLCTDWSSQLRLAPIETRLIRITFRLQKNELHCSQNLSTLEHISFVLQSLQINGNWCMYNQRLVPLQCWFVRRKDILLA